MKFSTLAFSTLVPITAFAICLNEPLDHDPLAITPSESKRNLNTLHKRGTTQVDAYVHVIVSKALSEPAKAVVQQKIDFLNSNFEPWNYQFNLQNVTTTVNPDWAAGIDNDKQAKMKALHKGNYQTLNVYMIEGAKSGLCSLPSGGTGDISQDKLDSDGCFVPWGPSVEASTLTHEVGHWMGLLHVWQGGCADEDGCDDTFPQETFSRPKMKTPEDLNSCPALSQCGGKGKQNVNNFVS
jgi:hypothetical protein